MPFFSEKGFTFDKSFLIIKSWRFFSHITYTESLMVCLFIHCDGEANKTYLNGFIQ